MLNPPTHVYELTSRGEYDEPAVTSCSDDEDCTPLPVRTKPSKLMQSLMQRIADDKAN